MEKYQELRRIAFVPQSSFWYGQAMETNLEWMERVYLKMDETTVSQEEMIEVA